MVVAGILAAFLAFGPAGHVLAQRFAIASPEKFVRIRILVPALMYRVSRQYLRIKLPWSAKDTQTTPSHLSPPCGMSNMSID